MEASTGIEPVYTDLQSRPLSNENKTLEPKKYQDKPKTQSEPDTSLIRLKKLGAAIADAADQNFDATCQLLIAAIDQMRAGQPVAPLNGAVNEAQDWANIAHNGELEAYFVATMDRLPNRQLGLKARKRLFMALWASFSEIDRAAFLARVWQDKTGAA